MKFLFLISILVSPAAFAEGETSVPAKTEETVTLSQEVTAPLFERMRIALVRAQRDGKVIAKATK